MRLKDTIKLTDEIVTLLPLHTQDIDNNYIVELANDYNIAKYTGHGFPHPYTIEDAQKFLDYSKNAWQKDTEYTFGIFIQNTYIGNISFRADYDNMIVSNIGYWLGKKFEGNGYMSRAVALLVDFCFTELAFRKIQARVYEGNARSMKLLEKKGFVLEGIQKKQYLLKDGATLDDYLFGLLK